eukprot:1831612-Prymnesium_polylepis.1
MARAHPNVAGSLRAAGLEARRRLGRRRDFAGVEAAAELDEVTTAWARGAAWERGVGAWCGRVVWARGVGA